MYKLLEPDPSLIAPREHPPVHDRAPEEIANGTPEWLRSDLVELIGEDQVLSRTIDLIRFASDASPYRMCPQVVVLPLDEEDVKKIFAYARQNGFPVTIRAAGPSLSGQSQRDGILLESKRHWAGRHFDEYLSSNRTCEVGMNLATAQDYRSVIFLLEELTR